MKNLLLLLLFVLVALTSNAQQWRVVAKVVHMHDNGYFRLYDSSRYIYHKPTNRGSNTTNDTIKHDEMLVYGLYSNLSSRVGLHKKELRDYYPNDELLGTTWYERGSNGMERIHNDSFFFQNGVIIQWLMYSKPSYPNKGDTNYQKVAIRNYTYNTKGLLVEMEQLGWVWYFFAPAKFRKTYYEYDVNNNVLADSVIKYDWNVLAYAPYYVTRKQYDTNNRIVQRTDITYDNNGKRKIWSRRYYYYNTNGRLAGDSVQTFIPEDSSRRFPEIRRYLYDGQGRLITDSFTRMDIDSVTNVKDKTVATYSYTSFGSIDSIKEVGTSYHASGSFVSKRSTAFEYEHYWPVSVSEFNAIDDRLYVYPVPTNNLLNIRLSNKGSGQIKGRIINLYGQKVYRWQDVAGKNYHKQVMVNHLAAGQYFVVLNMDDGEIKKRFVVVK